MASHITPLRGYICPDENSDPYYTAFITMMDQVDADADTAMRAASGTITYKNGPTPIVTETLGADMSSGNISLRQPNSALIGTVGTQTAFAMRGTFAPPTGNTPTDVLLSLEPTLNWGAPAGAGIFEALRIAITQTSVPTSEQYAIRVRNGPSGTTDAFFVYADGTCRVGNGNKTRPGLAFQHDNDTGFFAIAANPGRVYFSGNNGVCLDITGTQLQMDLAARIGWASLSIDTSNVRTSDIELRRDSQNTLALRVTVGTTPTWQAFQIYNTSDPTNYERLLVGWDNVNNAYLRTQAGGTGTPRNLYVGPEGAASLNFVSGGATRWSLDANGHLLAGAAGYDIGNGTLTADPRNVYARTAFVLSGNNGQAQGLKWKDELVAPTNAVASVVSTITLPAKAMLVGLDARVIVNLPGVTTWSAATDLDSPGSNDTRFGSSSTATAGGSIAGSTGMPYVHSAARNIKFLFNLPTTNATGRIRLTIWYWEVTPSTS